MDSETVSSIQYLEIKAASLLLYQGVFNSELGKSFIKLIQLIYESSGGGAGGRIGLNCLKAYGCWFKRLAAEEMSWQDYLLDRILKDENPFTYQIQRQPFEEIPPPLIAAVMNDLEGLQCFYDCSGDRLRQWVESASGIPLPPVLWNESFTEPEAMDQFPLGSRKRAIAALKSQKKWPDTLQELVAYYQTQGTGQFTEYQAFTSQSGKLRAIPHPDPVRLTQLVGYEFQQETLKKNTEFLLAGKPALNVLLYGSRGTGKSSLVKGLLNEYSPQGLRLIEIPKSQLQHLPQIVDELRDALQKFIIFVDDLSFEEDDDSFKALKVILEGTLTARPPNVVVYATSNRRHLVREFFEERPRPSQADEVHAWDTLQEKLSFSDRFGLTLTFEPANQDKYLAIVCHLATEAGLNLSPEDLEFQALQWATRNNGRSGRTARQFVDFMQSEQGMG
ncbi:ATP-binding protein [Laspinema sp. A4]|uniref:ATP-binding protein n=1 Tax=Laspinema sp. D2d TaxID=2953686 RepID=UPI0021BB9AA1|nr:ATP-binding protein [Laspinema sp. D2d]MCT7983844.1 ATP-binding protein [Laspinema sp. D2d]